MAKQKKLGRKIVLFEVTAKDGKEMLEKDNTSAAALFYRVLVAKGEAMQRVAIYEATKTKCESQAAFERLGNQTHDTLARLRKAGLVKRVETREAVTEARSASKDEKTTQKPKSASVDSSESAVEAAAF